MIILYATLTSLIALISYLAGRYESEKDYMELVNLTKKTPGDYDEY